MHVVCCQCLNVRWLGLDVPGARVVGLGGGRQVLHLQQQILLGTELPAHGPQLYGTAWGAGMGLSALQFEQKYII